MGIIYEIWWNTNKFVKIKMVDKTGEILRKWKNSILQVIFLVITSNSNNEMFSSKWNRKIVTSHGEIFRKTNELTKFFWSSREMTVMKI